MLESFRDEGKTIYNSSRFFTQRNIFGNLLNRTEIRLYLPCSDWFGTLSLSVWLFQINRCMANTIWFRFGLIRFRKYFSVCIAILDEIWKYVASLFIIFTNLKTWLKYFHVFKYIYISNYDWDYVSWKLTESYTYNISDKRHVFFASIFLMVFSLYSNQIC